MDPTARHVRRRFIAGLSVSATLLVGVLAYALFHYPMEDIGHSPKPNPPLWFGSTGALVFWLLLGMLVCGLYVWVAIAGTGRRGEPRTWRPAVATGLLVGVVSLVCGVLTDSTGQGGPLSSLGYLALLLACPLLGARAARRTGLVGTGALAAFWCAVVSALLFAVSILALDLLFTPLLIQGAWAHDPTCALYTGTVLAGCEISDDLGASASLLLVVPLLGALLGALGGALGAVMARRGGGVAARPAVPLWQGEARAPLLFGLAMLALVVVVIAGKLY